MMKFSYLKALLIYFCTFAIVFSVHVYLCWGHKVQIFAYVEDNRIFTESYFVDGSPVKNGTVILYNEKGNEIARGITDEKGLCDFPMPGKVKTIKIVIDAGMGHMNDYLLNEEDMK